MKDRRHSRELIHEGKYAAEVPIELHYSDESWSPTLSLDDAQKLERVRLALKRGDIAEAAKHGQIVAAGSPEDVAAVKRSYTGQFLKPILERGSPAKRRKRIEAAE
jgi:hypothetical protein